MSNATRASIHLPGWKRGPWDITLGTLGGTSSKPRTLRFPPHAQGLLYYHHPGEIRFRLCQTVDEFDHGSDLELPDGKTWRITLWHLLMKFSDPERSAVLNLIPDDTLSLSNWHVNPAQRVVTFSPEKISEQQIFDLSGATRVGLYTGASGDYSSLIYFQRLNLEEAEHTLFPDGSRGVFYYRQSRTAPTQVGELRFRLCDSVQSFEQGTDLLLPWGDIWHISSDQLFLVAEYRKLKSFLVEEGLLDCRLYPDELCRSAIAASRMLPHLLNPSQPFVLNLNQPTHSLRLWTGSRFELSPRFRAGQMLSKSQTSAYRGRALVRLESPPWSLSELQATGKPRGLPPLFVIRVLEMITPLERNPDWTDSDSELPAPTPGELYMRREGGKYVPWLIRGHRKDWHGFIPASPDTSN